MSANVDALRAALAEENKNLAAAIAARDAAQIDLAECTSWLGQKVLAVGARRREIEYLQDQIDQIEPRTDPDPEDPTNIPEIPDPEPEPDVEPDPTEPIEGETDE